MKGNRKFLLGAGYLAGGLTLIGMCVHKDMDAGQIAAVASALVALSPGIGAIIWGNVQEHRASNGVVE